MCTGHTGWTRRLSNRVRRPGGVGVDGETAAPVDNKEEYLQPSLSCWVLFGIRHPDDPGQEKPGVRCFWIVANSFLPEQISWYDWWFPSFNWSRRRRHFDGLSYRARPIGFKGTRLEKGKRQTMKEGGGVGIPLGRENWVFHSFKDLQLREHFLPSLFCSWAPVMKEHTARRGYSRAPSTSDLENAVTSSWDVKKQVKQWPGNGEDTVTSQSTSGQDPEGASWVRLDPEATQESFEDLLGHTCVTLLKSLEIQATEWITHIHVHRDSHPSVLNIKVKK